VTSTGVHAWPVVDKVSAKEYIRQFEGYHKLRSWLALFQLGLPTLRGIIVSSWTPQESEAVAGFAEMLGADRLLIRSDRRNESGKYPRGGYNVLLHQLPERVPWFLQQDRIVYLLEPRSPFNDLYSVNIAFWPDDPFVMLEIVGPGFDASDLKRGDLTPHEVIKLRREDDGFLDGIYSRTTMAAPRYTRSWYDRLAKVARMLESRNSDTNTSEDLANLTRRTLIDLGETLLLEHQESYPPIPGHLLQQVTNQASALPQRLVAEGMQGEPLILSMSFFGRDAEPIYWDVVWPNLKYTLPSNAG
jgi:hypothetical protein